MTREEAKSLLPVIQAFSEGKVIQYQTNGKWLDYQGSELGFDLPPLEKNYRIKPDPKYRPFANAEECWQEMQKHQPFGWLKEEGKDNYRLVGTINNEGLLFINHANNCKELSFWGAKKWLTFADGTPFGIKVEE